MSKITVTGQHTLTGGQLTAKATAVAGPAVGPQLWTWGYNTQGQLGLEDTDDRSSPVQVGNLVTWSSIDAGIFHNFAIKTDNTLWAWGQEGYGQTGHGDVIDRSSPVQVGTLANWANVSGGFKQSLAVKTDGTLWGWGLNDYGQLGRGNTTNYSSPVQIGGLSDWADVSTKNNHTLARKTDGTLWAWGKGSSGRLGQGALIDRSSPVQIGSSTDWADFGVGWRHSNAIKIDGTLWSWGINGFGVLGLGSGSAPKSSPVQVGSLTNWASIDIAAFHIQTTKTDGTLWAWGRNVNGCLGDGTIINRSSPIPIGALTDWASVSAGGTTGQSHAIKTDGSLWVWGLGAAGRLGLGDVADRSSPVQVGSDTDWTSVSVGQIHSTAIKTTS